MKRVLALDPGGTTGFVMITFDPLGNVFERNWEDGEICAVDHHAYLRNFLDEKVLLPYANKAVGPEFPLVICEGWDNRGKPDAELISLEYIGVVKGWAQERGIELRVPLPAEKWFADDRKLKVLGVYTRSRHINDAWRHLVKWLANDLKYRPILDVFHEKLA